MERSDLPGGPVSSALKLPTCLHWDQWGVLIVGNDFRPIQLPPHLTRAHKSPGVLRPSRGRLGPAGRSDFHGGHHAPPSISVWGRSSLSYREASTRLRSSSCQDVAAGSVVPQPPACRSSCSSAPGPRRGQLAESSPPRLTSPGFLASSSRESCSPVTPASTVTWLCLSLHWTREPCRAGPVLATMPRTQYVLSRGFLSCEKVDFSFSESKGLPDARQFRCWRQHLSSEQLQMPGEINVHYTQFLFCIKSFKTHVSVSRKERETLTG